MFLVLNLVFHNRCSKHWINLWDQAAYRMQSSWCFSQHDSYFRQNDSLGNMRALTSSGSEKNAEGHGLIGQIELQW